MPRTPLSKAHRFNSCPGYLNGHVLHRSLLFIVSPFSSLPPPEALAVMRTFTSKGAGPVRIPEGPEAETRTGSVWEGDRFLQSEQGQLTQGQQPNWRVP